VQESSSNRKIIVVDDAPEIRALLREFLTKSGYESYEFPSAVKAVAALHNPEQSGLFHQEVGAVISDIEMPEMSGVDLASHMQQVDPNIPVILITAFGSIESAMESIRRGAFDYITKPFKLDQIQVTLGRALRFRELNRENQILKIEMQKSWSLGNLIGKSSAMRTVFDLIERVAHASANILISGESGTGKEVVARAIHNLGPRSQRPFMAINCTAIPETLLESELFGHAKGAFTGAIQRRRGLLEEAEGGTVFLDEIGDMDLGLQAKLLRVIQERTIKSLGDNQSRPINVRIIAATHKDLRESSKKGHFREDLFYRLSVIPIVIPPLRHRREDIPLLAEHFLKKYIVANDSQVKGFTRNCIQHLMQGKWEGNVRELENAIERAVVLSRSELIDSFDFPENMIQDGEQFFGSNTGDFPSLQELEKRYIGFVLDKTGGRKEKASQILGINRRTLYRKEREYGFVTLEENNLFPGEDSNEPAAAPNPKSAKISEYPLTH
jgi:two-component system response regulator HydG